ncbi:MAG: MerR family transcriptional regulator [Erysipelotrichaceae bacterium]|nr:MerR family transcriptional regulator [Erysipelotrichaceae bacterium]
MSKYTTGEMAKLCDITVRTVQYYDNRGILVPSELSEGGRRLYSEDDVKRMKIIIFLRELGLSIKDISKLLSEEDPGSVIKLLLDQQADALKEDIEQSQDKLNKVESLRKEIRSIEEFSVESIGDIAYTMSNKKKLSRIHRNLLITGLPISILQWVAIILIFVKHIWWPLLAWLAIALIYTYFMSKYYFTHVAYICPHCHTIFQPSIKEGLFANHTYSTRKLTCPNCGRHGFCVEVAKEEES